MMFALGQPQVEAFQPLAFPTGSGNGLICLYHLAELLFKKWLPAKSEHESRNCRPLASTRFGCKHCFHLVPIAHTCKKHQCNQRLSNCLHVAKCCKNGKNLKWSRVRSNLWCKNHICLSRFSSINAVAMLPPSSVYSIVVSFSIPDWKAMLGSLVICWAAAIPNEPTIFK